jgi:galactose mutarotase-like enzyme
MLNLENNKVTVTIREKGSELQSIKANSIEYLWQANPQFWGKHAPVLFPVIGQLKDGEYKYKGNTYSLPRHGFARDEYFRPEKTTETSVTFLLESNIESLKVYPFQFEFRIIYSLIQNSLSCSYQISGKDDSPIYFSVGGHPAFNVPLNPKLDYSDYILQFESDIALTHNLLKEGLITDQIKTLKLKNHKLALTHELFYEDAIVLKNLRSKQIKLFSPKDPHGLNFHFEDFPYFGIWAAKNAPFVCLEPWCGIADSVLHNKDLVLKEGIVKLLPGKKWERNWTVELF